MVERKPAPEKIKIPSSHGKTRIGSIYVGSFGDGDLWINSPTKGGRVVVTHVPPREPVTGALVSVESIMVQAEQLSSAQISEHFKTSAASRQDVLEGSTMLSVENRAPEACSAMDKHAVQLAMLQFAGDAQAARRMKSTQIEEVAQ